MTSEPTRHEQMFRVPESLECLTGHFPGLPVVPAIVQIDWVMAAARNVLGTEPILLRLEMLKFQALLRPADAVRLTTDLSADKTILTFRLWNEQQVFSTGRCILRAQQEHRA